MDQVYNILSREINIDADRQRYTAVYDFVRNTVVDGLRANEHFRKLFCSTELSGSYKDKLKISKPDEFDVVMCLELPEKELIKIYRDETNKGNALIDLTDVLICLSNDKNNEKMYDFLKKMVNGECLLLQNRIQQWLESCMVKFLNEIDRKITYANEEYKFIYKKSGPAHTIYVQNIKEDKPLFSVDFVPGFLFKVDRSVSTRTPRSEYWTAVPRPLKWVEKRDNPSFCTAYADSERKIMKGKNQLKNALRLMKKFRDLRPKLQHLKSYYIKTIFLWLDEEVEDSFWNEPIFRIIREAFKRLENALLAGEIKSFWNTELNLLQSIKTNQIIEMHREVVRARKTLMEPRSQKSILKLFLSPEEQTNVSPTDMQLIADSLEAANTPTDYVFYSFVCLFAVIVCYQVYRIFIQKSSD